MAKIKVKWVKSAIGFAERQKRTIKAGLDPLDDVQGDVRFGDEALNISPRI